MKNGIKLTINNLIKDILSLIYKFLDAFRLNNINKVYDSNFFTKRLSGKWRDDIDNISKIIYQTYEPDSVIDFGCGSGAYLYKLKDLGTKIILGVDGSKEAINNSVVEEVVHYDLRDKYESERAYDLVICFEVAEHIHEKYSSNLLDTLVDSCGKNSYILFTAALKGQRGKHHVNLKSKKWWIRKFEKRGMTFKNSDTKKLASELNKKVELLKHIPRNLMVFQKL